ncbi:phasin family protein [Methanococcoides sp. FTZ1]|uniref:phasin family protein n=1 Tax=Methanococcoides sp. FTZ1 TaxID=3439061 RepID=UPI003F83D970
MIDTMKKLGLFGLGLYAITEEKIDEYVKELVEKGDFNKEEGKKFVEDLLERQRQQQEDLEDRISAKVQEVFGKSDLASKEEIEALHKKIEDLEELLKEKTKEETASEKAEE